MSHYQNVDTCHKTRIENCKGSLLDPILSYDKWAYWCKLKKGWFNKQCDCKKK